MPSNPAVLSHSLYMSNGPQSNNLVLQVEDWDIKKCVHKRGRLYSWPKIFPSQQTICLIKWLCFSSHWEDKSISPHHLPPLSLTQSHALVWLIEHQQIQCQDGVEKNLHTRPVPSHAPWYLPKKLENVCPNQHLYTEANTSFIHNCQNSEAMKMSRR